MVCGAFHHGLFSGYAVEGGESDKGKSGQVQYCGRVCQAIRGLAWREKALALCRVGHKVLLGERFTNSITKAQGDSILRADLRKLCRMFSYLGRDSLIVSVLAYNVGCSRIKGYGKIPKSRLLKKLESGDRDIYKEYVSFRCYKGKVVPSIERRRKVEYMLLFEK